VTESLRPRIAILTADDRTWALPAWYRALSALRAEYDVVGVRIFPSKLARMRGSEALGWYFRTFGVKNTLLFSLYSMKSAVKGLFAMPGGWNAFEKAGVPIAHAADPNDPAVAEWIMKNRVDVVLIFLNDVLKGPVLKAARAGVVNKHAGVLPQCRGLFPFLWSRLNGLPPAVTCHLVDEGVDTGRVLFEERRESGPHSSMLAFYTAVYRNFPETMRRAVRETLAKADAPAGAAPAAAGSRYYGLPSRGDVVAFERAGYRVAEWKDLSRNHF